MDLERFSTAQEDRDAGIDAALAELRAGRKVSHWIWYIFPQLAGLGRSEKAQFFGLTDLGEACEYLADPLLRSRLLLATQAVADQLSRGIQLTELMGGSTDAMKVVSSLTLFEAAAGRCEPTGAGSEFHRIRDLCETIFGAVARQGFQRCEFTRAQVNAMAIRR